MQTIVKCSIYTRNYMLFWNITWTSWTCNGMSTFSLALHLRNYEWKQNFTSTVCNREGSTHSYTYMTGTVQTTAGNWSKLNTFYNYIKWISIFTKLYRSWTQICVAWEKIHKILYDSGYHVNTILHDAI